MYIYTFCTAVMCSVLTSPENGMIAYSSDITAPYDHGTVATYSCSTGFGLTGEATRTCTDGDGSTAGVWSGAAPTCEREGI